jgi:hypothetical protein
MAAASCGGSLRDDGGETDGATASAHDAARSPAEALATDSETAPEVAAPEADLDAASNQPEAQTPYECPGITSVSASPAEALPGQVVSLGIATLGTVTDVVWTTSCPCPPCGGTIVDSDGGAGFVCDVTCQTLTVTAKVVGQPDGAAADVCADASATMMSTTVVCEGCNDIDWCLPPLAGCNLAPLVCGSAPCTDLQSDPYNCGACANACAIGQACSSGSCVAMPSDAGGWVDASPDGGSGDL